MSPTRAALAAMTQNPDAPLAMIAGFLVAMMIEEGTPSEKKLGAEFQAVIDRIRAARDRKLS